VTRSEYQELAEFIAVRFNRMDQRFDQVETRLDGVEVRLEGVETRLTKVEVNVERLKDEIRIVAEAVVMNGERIERLEAGLGAA
jgi:archaellum component FlaC